ncbi:LOW QUALITY PROTEIN: uncharacterized protein EMH_0026210 [Eimeria mitis]|uniref:Uncharacterized protein n=1 Tax=Eimeria mitis TaxID=44415 RepID=U6KG17_9EIME|nr:LOW QUALITY PROTEIN: uncharacterized protein EMH_0026210 [Eimeria mitis]CDJ36864.1 hypothetical protein, conserved [Eimeria mitis]
MQAADGDFGAAAACVSPHSEAAAVAAEPLPATVSLQELERLLQDVWGAERDAKCRVLLLLQQGEERLRDMQLSLQQQQQQSEQVCRRVPQLHQQLLGKGISRRPLALRLQEREQQQQQLLLQLRCIQEVEACLLLLQEVQHDLEACGLLVQRQQLAVAAATLRQCALKRLLPLLRATTGRQEPAIVAELHQQFAEVYGHLVEALDLQLQQHLKLAPQQITVNSLIYSSASNSSNSRKEASSSSVATEAPGMATRNDTAASEASAAAAAAGAEASAAAPAAGAAEIKERTAREAAERKTAAAEFPYLRLRDVWEALNCLGLLRRRLYTLTEAISNNALHPLLAAVVAGSRARNNNSKKLLVFSSAPDGTPAAAAGAAAAGAGEAAAVASLTPQGVLLVVQSLLQFLLQHATGGHPMCLRVWAPLLQRQLQQQLGKLFLQQAAKQLWLEPKPEAAAAATAGATAHALPFLAVASAAAGIVQTELFLLQQGVLQQQELLPLLQQQGSGASWKALHLLAQEDRRRQVELQAAARQLLQQTLATAAAAAAEQDTMLATEDSVPGGIYEFLLPQGLPMQQQPQQQQQQRLLLLQCIAEEADVSLVQLAPLRITRQTWLLLQLLQSLLRGAAAAASTCTCSSWRSGGGGGCGVNAVPCWCSSRRGGLHGFCSSSCCCCSRIALRAEVAAVVSIADLFLLLRPLGALAESQATEPTVAGGSAVATTPAVPADAGGAAALAAAVPTHLRALALRWTDTEVLSRWMTRLPLLLSAAAGAASKGSYENCSCSSKSRCCPCPGGAARRAFTVWGDSLPLFDAIGAASVTPETAAAAGKEQQEAPFGQQLAEIVVALKRQQEESYVCLVWALKQGLQQAAKELIQILTNASRSSNNSKSSLEIHVEAAAGLLTQRLHSAALDLLPLLPLQVYAEVVGLAADCLLDCVLRGIVAVAVAAAAGVSTPEAAAAAAGSSISRAAAQRMGPICCRLLQRVCAQVEATLVLHLSHQHLRPEAAAAATAAVAPAGDALASLLRRMGASTALQRRRSHFRR